MQLEARICFHLARRKLTSSTWEPSHGWHQGEPNHGTNSPPVKSQRLSSTPMVGLVNNICVSSFLDWPLAENTIETHHGCPPQIPLDVTLVTIRHQLLDLLLWCSEWTSPTAWQVFLALGSLMPLTFNQAQMWLSWHLHTLTLTANHSPVTMRFSWCFLNRLKDVL